MMMSRVRTVVALSFTVVGLVASGAVPAQAQTVVYNNLGPGSTYDPTSGYAVSGLTSGAGANSAGFAFTPTLSGNLLDISVVMANSAGTTNAHFYLVEASALPGTLNVPLESWTLTGLPDFATPFSPQVLTSVSSVFLDSSKTYYLYSAETGDQDNIWLYNNQSDSGVVITSTDNTNYDSTNDIKGAFQVRVTTSALTPEAPGLLQFLPALLPVALVLRRRRGAKK